MPSSSHSPFLTIRAEGALLPVDLLQRIVENDKELGGLTPESYHLSGEKLNEAINRSWNRLVGAWAAFNVAKDKDVTEHATGVTRDKWLLPLFQELGYGQLQPTRAIDIEGKEYPISHQWNETPIHLLGHKLDLDKRTPGASGAAKASPHSLTQEALNRSPERTWGFVSNGLRLRVLRDNASLTRQAYLEFDLEAMMNGEVYADFVVLWLVCHVSRVEVSDLTGFGNLSGLCWLEKWSKAAQERGTRALEGLRGGVEKAIEALGKGFIGHPANGSLRSVLSSGAVSTLELYRQLLRLVYRLIFLFVAEDRQLLYDPASDAESRERYARYYSTARLRRMAERVRGSRHADLYVALKLVMDKLGNGGAPELGLPALGGFLFSRAALSALGDCELSNEHLLEAVRALAFTQEGRTRRAVDYKNLGSEELGSIYESLLELHPTVNTAAATFELRSVSGSERKTTGSYYTPSSLIQVLLDSALEPVIADALKRVTVDDRPQTIHHRPPSIVHRQEEALLNLKVIDPACGSGHFLVAAAHRLARRLASIRTGEGEPAPEAMRSALRAVISNCIYGVDINPMSVELCKVSLWMEALEPGKPLSFLDAHIQCGDSLVGVAPGLDISEIPDEAFNPAFGDDKATSTALKKRNKRERGGGNKDKAGQLGFRFDVTVLESMDDLARWLAERAAQVDAMPEDDSTQALAKAQAFDDYHNAREYLKERLELDLWTASFFWTLPKGEAVPKADAETMLAPTQQELIQLRNGGELDVRLVEKVHELSERLNFFHWELAFPQVFSGENAGFDCVLGNPPWERIKLQEQEFFAQHDPEIAAAPNKAARQKRIDALATTNPALAQAFEDAKHAAEATSKFVRESARFPLTAVGDVNTYALFAEHFRSLLAANGRAGIIVPTGIATDDTTKQFFGDLVDKHAIATLFDFENREKLFAAVDSRMKFCLLTLSGAPVAQSEFIFFATRVEHLQDTRRRFSLLPTEIALFNPNTRTMPVFRTRSDADLTRKIYQNIPVLVNEGLSENFWEINFSTMFHMSNDSNLFLTEPQEGALPLYEAKLIWHFDHHWATYEQGNVREVSDTERADAHFTVSPRYWVPKTAVEERLGEWKHEWLLGFRDVTNATNERTSIFSVLPKVGVGHKVPLIFVIPEIVAPYFFANMNSLILDYIARQKIGGMSMSYFIMKQLPVLPPSAYSPADPSTGSGGPIAFIAPRVLELVYTAYDLRPFAEDMWNEDDGQQTMDDGKSLRELYVAQWEANRRDPESQSVLERFPSLKDARFPETPFIWNESRRAQIRAELDAYYARLYGLTRDELRYILDPKEVYGEDFPGETFRVLKEKEIKQFGEYRTRRLVLEAWDEMEG